MSTEVEESNPESVRLIKARDLITRLASYTNDLLVTSPLLSLADCVFEEWSTVLPRAQSVYNISQQSGHRRHV